MASIPYAQGSAFVQQDTDTDVLTAAQERIAACVRQFDTIAVSYSGGKDSTVLYELTQQVAATYQKPILLIYGDEEVVDPDTTAYAGQVYAAAQASGGAVTMHWCCVPVRHSLRSDRRAVWYPWDPDEQPRWFRQPPPFAVTADTHPTLSKAATKGALHFNGLHQRLFSKKVYGRVCQMSGVRAQEGINRRRDILNAGTFLSQKGAQWYAKPIYDWKTVDIWYAIGQFGWSYSRVYDKLSQYGLSYHAQRVSSWGNVAAARETKMWAELYPDAWARALVRLPELDGQARYGNTKLYRKNLERPPGLTWHEWVLTLLNGMAPERRSTWEEEIVGSLRRWTRVYAVAFPDEPIPGSRNQSWKQIAQRMAKNDAMPRDRYA